MRSIPVLAAVLLLCALPGYADDETPRARLNRALELEKTPGSDPDAPLTIYAAVAELADQPPDIRADALTGAARCHLDADRPERARPYLQRIVEDKELREEARTWATAQLAGIKEPDPGPSNGGESSTDFEEHLAREQARRKREAQELLRRARIELEARRYKLARSLCLKAMSKDFENAEAAKLLEEIESSRPEMGDLLRRLIHFIQTGQLEDYQRLKARVDDLHQRGKRAADKKDYAEADRLLREAIRLIDQSDFLTTGGALDIETLATVRTEIRTRLTVVRVEGRAVGLTFGPEPPLPDVARSGGVQKEFYALLARIFSPREPGQEPLRFYDFAPAPARDADPKALVRPDFSMPVTHRPGSLTRARWAERWIRRHVGARWADPSLARVKGGAGARILTRFRSLICAQHREIEHARIRKLREGFADRAPPLRINLHLFAAGPGAAVRVAEALRARMLPGETGTWVMVRERLIEDCVAALEGTENLLSLGGAEILLDDGESALALEFTHFTEQHPLYQDLPPPALTVPDRDARYGLWLDLYSEDMPNRARPGNDRSALSVRVRVLQPGEPQHSHVVPRRSREDPNWTRLPLMTEQVREADGQLRHFDTFALFGLTNPFPETRTGHGELIVLIGVRPRSVPTPEPPREPNPRIVPADDSVRDYALGPLATEVEDHFVAEDWPELHAVGEGLSADGRQRSRDHFLSLLLGSMANVDNAGSPDIQPIVVHGGIATANISEEEHVRAQQAVMRLRGCQNHLYVVRVESAVMPQARWTEWQALEGVAANVVGSLRAAGEVREAMERELAALREAEHLFNTAPVPVLARSTEKILQTSTRARDITKDLHVRQLDQGRQRYTPVRGRAEEGLVVEVRPGIEQLDGALRKVSLRIRAARLKSIESREYPRATQPAARYEVPLWHETQGRSFVEATDLEILDDRTALFVPLALPGGPDEVIVVSVAVVRAQ